MNPGALRIGARLLERFIDGFVGTRIRAEVDDRDGAGWFRIDLQLPYDKPIRAAQDEAEVFLRHLTRAQFPPDFFKAALLEMDRDTLFALGHLATRAALLTHLERTGEDVERGPELLTTHWESSPSEIQFIAKRALNGLRIMVHARPIDPIQPKVAWEAREELAP